MRSSAAIGALVLLCAGSGALADESAQELLRKMHDATRELNYDGVFIYQRGDQIDSMRLIHAFDGESEIERLISLSGPAREVIRDGSLVTCLFADDQAAMVEKSAPRDIIGIGFSAPVDELLANYTFSIGGKDRIAGRVATRIAVAPARNDRYGYTLWLDDESKLLLKSVILGESGRTLEQVQFTHIDLLDQIAADMLDPEISGAGFKWQMDADGDAESTLSAADMAWHVQWLPAGFEFREGNVQSMATSHTPVNHLVFSDGLAMVSVFVEPVVEGDPPLQGYSSRGAVNAFSRVADHHQITVVGEVPQSTVRRIAASVAKKEK